VTYETIARLGRGGMGVVDLARGPDGSKVALKRLTLHGSANEIIRARQRLLREAEVLRRLHHPNVVRLVDVIDEGDEIVLVMPYLSGGSLAERVAQHGPAPADEVERQARRLFGALAQAHALGIVHRDIKPANILFDERGEPCLADFGVAQTWDQTHGLTMTGMVVGTPGFMAPEQARGEQVLPASDVFSLGATLLFAATGEGPFGPGDPALLMVRAASNKVDKVPRTLPASLRRLLSDTLDTRPDRRPTAAAVVGSPHGFMAGLPSVPRPQSGLSWAIVVGVVAVVLLIAAAFTFIGDEGDDDGDRPLEGAAGAPTTTVGPGGEGPGDVLGTPTDEACDPLPYQPCGEEAAPYTDGVVCVDDHADHDGDPANGCEAAPDEMDGTVLVLPEDAVEATMVPDDDVDSYPLAVDDAFTAACSTGFEMVLDAPPGLDLLLDVTVDGDLVESMTVPGGESAALPMADPCPPSATDGRPTPPGAVDLHVTAVGGGGVGEPYALRLRIPT
jgi:hypothetical protein